MANFFAALRQNARLFVQLSSTALSNGYVVGFARGKIFTGNSKAICVPGLNCYSCPGALGACPLGSLQSMLASGTFKFTFYVLGFLLIFGALFGRFICGWLCPFGLVQDLIHKIPFAKKLKKLPFDKALRWIKYILLVAFVIILPLFVQNLVGMGDPWFCKYVCPSGTLFAGIPLVLTNTSLQAAIGSLFAWKFLVLAVIIVLSIIVYRPFCRYLCPLGAIYGMFNPIALYRYELDLSKCTRCGKCTHACKLNIEAFKTPNSPECIRCGACLKSCPTGAIHRHKLGSNQKHK